jgi:hypothetical protein
MTDSTFHRLVAKMELMADMKRALTDCRRNYYSRGDDGIGAILQTLREIYPTATSEELLMVLEAAETELHEEVERLGGWPTLDEEAAGRPDITPEVEAWCEQAKLRIFDLGETKLSVE